MYPVPTGKFKWGERFRILGSSGMKGRIVELRGPLGPKGMLVYRVRYRKKPKPAYIEVREDQLEILPDPTPTAPLTVPAN